MWTYGSVRIYTQTDVDAAGQIIPRIQPLAGSTILQIFGYDSTIKNLTAIVVGVSDHDTLEGFSIDGSTHSLVSPEGTVGNFYLKSLSIARQFSIFQTMRSDLDCDAEVYLATLELYGG